MKGKKLRTNPGQSQQKEGKRGWGKLSAQIGLRRGQRFFGQEEEAADLERRNFKGANSKDDLQRGKGKKKVVKKGDTFSGTNLRHKSL